MKRDEQAALKAIDDCRSIAPYESSDLRGFSVPIIHGADRYSLWFATLAEAKKALSVIIAKGRKVDYQNIVAQQCDERNGLFVWSEQPEWSSKIREDLEPK